jgi:hypothetical protein
MFWSRFQICDGKSGWGGIEGNGNAGRKMRGEAKVPRSRGVREGQGMRAVISRSEMAWTGLVRCFSQMHLRGGTSAASTNAGAGL